MYLYLPIILHIHKKYRKKRSIKKIRMDILRNSSLYEKIQDLDMIFAMQQFFWLLNQLPRPPTCTFESSVFFGKVPISLLKNSFRYSEIKEFKISEFREKLLLVFQYYFKREEKWCWKQQTENREILAQQIFHLLENYV